MSGYNVGIGRKPKDEMDEMMTPAMRRKASSTMKSKSPAKHTDGFNDTYLGNGPVPTVPLATGDPGSRNLPRSVGKPRGVVEADGTANLRTDVQTKTGSYPGTPSGGKTSLPSGVDRFGDGRKV